MFLLCKAEDEVQLINALNLFWNVFYTKRIEISNIIIIMSEQRKPMSTHEDLLHMPHPLF